jgi:beta-galactosidase
LVAHFTGKIEKCKDYLLIQRKHNEVQKMKTKIISLLFLLASLTFASAQQKHTFSIRDSEFMYDNKPVKIHSGEMHYARIPHEYWKQRLQMIKAMGLNTVATYVFWNFHETAPGVWDFTSGDRNIREFIKLAGEEGLMVILRPGPYACAEWEFGGYPWWLQKNKELVIRTNNKPFLDSCNVYISKLIEQVKDLQITKGGPVIMIQAENEFGSYVAQRKDIPMAEHKKYSYAIREQLINAGVEVPLFTSDGSWLFDGGTIEGAMPTANGEDDIDNLKKVVNQYHGNKGPYMVAEFYPGWLDHWAEAFEKVSTETIVTQMKKYLDNNVSFNFYMVHGGTNFGFTSGANYDKNHDIQPDITSYDYDAPISEAGWATPKYMAIREELKKYVSYSVPEIPEAYPVIAITSIKLLKAVDIVALKEKIKPVISDKPLTFEDLNQGQGYVLYSKKFPKPISGKLEIKGLRDFATVYVNGEKVGELNRYFNNYSVDVDIPLNATLEILVENMGRINYGSEIIHNLKGIISPVVINGNEITGNWLMYKFPLDEKPEIKSYSNKNIKGRPAFYSGSFKLDKTGDTFLDMRKWGKGIVFINGHNLGRYWNVGPQQTLFIPGVWLNKGKNEIVIFEQLNDIIQSEVSCIPTPILDELRSK